ncbi:Hypothetical protein R9X50_00798100 [Acrodontium crateriforme]|uniref:AB hydrolase-1 domain-containing protein n=1 Tax=Acrodontium crateriforme TaxID=150365 RepID=A0AAQ3MAI9_9PEZI|nr:Hypothetical protein R9X50_00798100 [Acrodontium crateriforme]
MRASTVLFAASSLAVASATGGLLPAGVKTPNTNGFKDPIVHLSKGGRAVCVSGYIPVEAFTDKGLKFNFEVPETQIGLTETFLEYVTPGSGFMDKITDGMMSINGTYQMYSTLCTPAHSMPKGVQLLTHGVGFDSSYWDFAPGYSYVDVAVEYGYATFSYDRLATGKSDKPAPLMVQTPIELEIANNLVKMLRSGKMCDHRFDKVVGAGHSYGSLLTQGITAKYPMSLDAAILTGFSVNTSAIQTFITGLNLAIAAQNQPDRFHGLDPGYLVSNSVISNQIGFFKAPGFDPKILTAAEATKGPVTYGQLFSQSAVSGPAINYVSPVAVVDGESDLPFCYGNCSTPMDLANAVRPALYPMLAGSKFGHYLAPVAGHGLNLHYSAVTAYHYIQDFLKDQGLGM